VPFAGRPVETDVSPGAWIADALEPADNGVVASLVPPVFEAYARVFHPAVRYVGDDDVDVRWAEVARANGTVAHPAMEWGSITGALEFFDEADQPPVWNGAPPRGHVPQHVAQRLAAVLRQHTGTPEDCWFGISTEWGFVPPGLPHLFANRGWRRPVLLIRGPVELAAANMEDDPGEQGPTIWWPADRSWFVATDLDLVTTYVGGSAACIAGLVAHPDLEVARVPPDQGITWDSDTINPLPEDAPA
jgi:hypothetical protein